MNNELTPGQKYAEVIRKAYASNAPDNHEITADFFDRNSGTPEGRERIKNQLKSAVDYRKTVESGEAHVRRLNELLAAIHDAQDMDFMIEAMFKDS